MPTRPVPVLIVDDQAFFRSAAQAVLAVTPGFTAVGEAASGEEAITRVTQLQPGLVLMDIHLPGISGIEATRRIVGAHPDTAVLLLSTYRAEDLPADARDCGAIAYLHKEDFEPEVLERIWVEHQPVG
jgi:two-component system, NarL family, invasion response regulator UvrY